MKEFEIALGYDDISLLPNFSEIDSRKEVNTKTNISRNIELEFPLVLSPMDSVSTVESCVKMNQIGAAGILHRFMSIEEQAKKTKTIRDQSGKSFSAIGLSDYRERINWLVDNGCQLLFLDSANGLNKKVFDFTKWYYLESEYPKRGIDLIVGNTLSKESVSRLVNLGADGVRHLIGPGSACLTARQTAIYCPSITGLYYGWKAIRNWRLYNNDWSNRSDKEPTVLADGGIRYPSDLCKAIASGSNAIIAGGIFAGCFENSNEIVEVNGKKMVKYRGMASKEVVEKYGLSDNTNKNLFVEGDSYYKSYQNKSVEDVVYEFANGLRSCLSYLGMKSLNEMRGGLWNNTIQAVKITGNSLYEGGAHGKVF